MAAGKHVFTAIEPLPPSTGRSHDERQYRLPNAYHKILDYHVAEILIGTIVLAATAFLRFRFHH